MNQNVAESMYSRCGNSGLKLPKISLGLWHNFGESADYKTITSIINSAFDYGITHFDLANNYGPPPGSAEENFGKILKDGLMAHRDEIIVSTKAGFRMWDGPYGEWGSKKYLVASLNASLKRMGLEYVDIFYHHRPDPETPMWETALALDLIVRQGKALYVGISNYNAEQTEAISAIFDELKTPFIIHQPSYSMLNRWVENGLTDVLKKHGKGMIAFSPLAQGQLTNRYLDGIPSDSRIKTSHFLNEDSVNSNMPKIIRLNELAQNRGQTLAQMSIAWLLNNTAVTSVLVGVSKLSQLQDNVGALDNLSFTSDELDKIEQILK